MNSDKIEVAEIVEGIEKAKSKYDFDKETYEEKQSLEEKKDYIENLSADIAIAIGFIGSAEEAMIKLGVKSKAGIILGKSLTMLTKGRKSLKKELKRLG